MRDEFSGRTFLEVTFLEGLKFKTSFNFDLIDYNTLDYTNPKIGPAVNTGGGASREYTRTFSWTWNNIVTYDKTFLPDKRLTLTVTMCCRRHEATWLCPICRNWLSVRL